MQIDFSSKAKADLNFCIKSGNKSLLSKIYSLIEDIKLHPFEGIGKPEPFKTSFIRILVKENKSGTSNYLRNYRRKYCKYSKYYFIKRSTNKQNKQCY